MRGGYGGWRSLPTATHPSCLCTDCLPLQPSPGNPSQDVKDPSKTRAAYSPQDREPPNPADDGVEREVKWGRNIPASAEQAKEELKNVSDRWCLKRTQPCQLTVPAQCNTVLPLAAVECLAANGCGHSRAGRPDALTEPLLRKMHSRVMHPFVNSCTTAVACLARPQAGQGLAESVEMGVNVLISKAKDAAAAAQRAVGLQPDRPEMSKGTMGAAGKMEYPPPGSQSGWVPVDASRVDGCERKKKMKEGWLC